MPTFQETILTLQQYWNKQGCALLQPYDMEVGAGTSHTATFLRALREQPGLGTDGNDIVRCSVAGVPRQAQKPVKFAIVGGPAQAEQNRLRSYG